MSFGLPPVKPKPELSVEPGLKFNNQYEVPDLMAYGLASARTDVDVPHPVMLSEQNYHKNRSAMNMAILRNTQGLHAPLRIQMELNAAKKVGHLPFLPSSNLMYDVLTGRDIEMGPEDVLSTAEFMEMAGQPHAVVERSLGIL